MFHPYASPTEEQEALTDHKEQAIVELRMPAVKVDYD